MSETIEGKSTRNALLTKTFAYKYPDEFSTLLNMLADIVIDQLQVQIDPETLKEKNVTLNEIVKTTGEALWVSPLSFLNSSTPGTGGFFDTQNQ